MIVAKKLALLIGNDQYDDAKFTGLTVPQNDVIGLNKVLERSDIGAFDQVKTLMNQSRGAVEMAIAELYGNKKRDDFLLLYFSGHGLLDVDGDLYLALKNTRYDQPFGTALTSSYIKTAINKSKSRRQVLILDCCHSGAFERGTKGPGAPAITEQTFEVNGYGREILTSSTATQLSWQGDQVIGHTDKSLFTHYLVQGLDSLTRSLQASLDEVPGVIHITTVSGQLKPGAKGAADVLGKLMVSVSEKAIPAVAGFINSWISRPGARPVEIEVQGKGGSAKIVFDPNTISVNEIESLVAKLQSNVRE